ncbi:hypothetical protein D9758_009486 [Tetrapyrgos nigripes]|uniref:Nephrocystin 3-like N-terminal domain-containing protein n=1 Tax=Tetrapyrgos nigripes TaxID=182062 RepID=A0A8H5G148_9AGAR|nr:hypothetical protein D9758_009486 [Tetrapyrgos nigripes]
MTSYGNPGQNSNRLFDEERTVTSRRRGLEDPGEEDRDGRQVRPRVDSGTDSSPALFAQSQSYSSNDSRDTGPGQAERDVAVADHSHSLSLFAQSHDQSFNNSYINAVGGHQTINNNTIRDSEDGLKLLYQKIAHVGAFHDSEARHPPPRCHPGTRRAVLADIAAWITGEYGEDEVGEQAANSDSDSEDPEGSNQPPFRHIPADTPIHWLHGPPDSGKSAIAQTLAERFAVSEEGGHLAASFFFSRSEPARNNPAFLFTTIAYCLATGSGDAELRAAIDLAVKRQPAVLSASIDRQFRDLIVRPLQRLPLQNLEALPKLIIIDGLDECQYVDSVRRALSSILSGLLNNAEPRIPLRFLIVSRPETAIQDYFDQQPNSDLVTRTVLGDAAPREIKRYLRDRFNSILQRDGMAAVPRPWPRRDVMEQLAQRAAERAADGTCGEFSYLKSVLKYVGSGRDSRPTALLDLALGPPLYFLLDVLGSD